MRAYLLRATAFLLACAFLVSACTKGGPTDTSTQSKMQVAVASSDLYAHAPQRFSVGLVFASGKLVSFGSVGFRFSYVGTATQAVTPRPGPQETASFIPTPGMPEGQGFNPTITDPTQARGVYEAENVTFDSAGIWSVSVTAKIQGSGTQTASAAFQVASKPTLPAPGQRALRTKNLTIHLKGVPLAAIDSRASVNGTIPDRNLHEWTIAKAIADHRPVLVVFATPVYCISRFCGPVTNVVEQLSRQYANRAVFIHVEIWRNFNKHVINKAAASWLFRNGDLTEPWLYLIGANGVIVDRWSSLFDVHEVAQDLQRLPPMK
jgi:hypothetical protein